MESSFVAAPGSLIVPLALILLGSAAVAWLLVLVHGRAAELHDLEELPQHTQPVDVEAFRNLVDPAEEEYLRQNLPTRDFRRLQRERLRAALEYVQQAAFNAAVLVRLGEAARHSPQAEVASAGRELVNDALRLRLAALLAEVKLWTRLLLPGARLSPAPPLLERYQHLTGAATRLSRAWKPAFAGRISAAL